MNIEIHCATDCPYCVQAKSYLTAHGIPFHEFVYDDFAGRQAMYDRFGLTDDDRTVPQIFIDGKRLGGWRELRASDVVTRHQVEPSGSDS